MTSQKVVGYAMSSKGGHFIRHQFERNEPGPDDVEFDVKFCGVCHSDVHIADSDLKEVQYPIVPGHELSGVVTRVGNKVTDVAIGDHIGVGCMVESCRSCNSCDLGDENYCRTMTGTYGDNIKHKLLKTDTGFTQGGYCERMVVHRHYAFKLPKAYPLEKAGPLLCSAITLYTPLKKYGCLEGGLTIGILGIGGLGVAGVKLAKAMGNKVIAISSSPNKLKFCMQELGCDGFIVRSEKGDMDKYQSKLDLIVNCASHQQDVNDLLGLIKCGGTVNFLGLINKPLAFSSLALLGNKQIGGTCIGGVPNTNECIHFCDKNGIYPNTEKITSERLDEVYEILRKNGNSNSVRFVLDIEKSKSVKMPSS